VPRPIHFEIPADRPAQAVAFYEKVFGWLAYCADSEGKSFGIM
jgi:predicted enzyme related to lactoylglutathione lyase